MVLVYFQIKFYYSVHKPNNLSLNFRESVSSKERSKASNSSSSGSPSSDSSSEEDK